MNDVLEFLYSLQFSGIKLGLQNIKNLLEYHNIDYKSLKFIHIAGTNGKGSTANILNSIYSYSGYKVGLFTSPHITSFNERIRVNGEMITDSELSSVTSKLKDGIKRFNTTFFEATTAIAIQYFIERNVDLVIFETGLGGRFDSTNIVDPILSIITTIGYDHQSFLGNSIVGIAKEKAGIIKRGVPLVVNEENKLISNIFKSKAHSLKSPFYLTSGRKIRVHKNGQISFKFNGEPVRSNFSLNGKFQIKNFRAVLQSVEILNSDFPVSVVQLKKSLSNLYVKGRMEEISKDPWIILDAAHNQEGLNNLKEELKSYDYKNLYLITGVLKDKDYGKILKILSTISNQIAIFPPFNKRSLDINDLKTYISRNGYSQFNTFQSSREAFRQILRKYCSGDLILVTGSHFVLSDFISQCIN
ncbi:MAG: hypothetical protein CR982_02970 [Candidatus Cloacimonadota bacterium]|nr:MAG: hypothetical protein CR982_02970 [Candidatus Cloacimonadota bacterium]PIE82027.1 MAG: hypothetical protein CSA15_00160 [Candidatus Delongbacteria bacterium]